MSGLLSTSEAGVRCGVTSRTFKLWRTKFPGICVPREWKGRLQFFELADIDALKRKVDSEKAKKWAGG